ncbi:hypothetical protein ERUR111494_00455 [Erysipelothrix urinaevulpis]|uniref:hypothetical protein n=1 Tax=Erysipelothrix urinaevulpis TaxID=2683717 RepID=UPI00135A3204|nr:hypothetical protein [Erysipelothrix urinaevulpis]
MKKFKQGIILVLMISLLSACSKIPQQKKEENISTDNNAVLERDKDVLTPKEIADAFKKETNNAYKIKSIEFINASKTYKIDGYGKNDEIEMKLDGKTGGVIVQNLDDLDKNNHEITDKHLESIDKIVDLSLADAKGSYKLKDWELEYDVKRFELSVELVDNNQNDIDYTYDIETEKLIEKDI